MGESHFLTRLEINPRRRLARKYLGSPQVMHAAVEAAFPSSAAGHRKLWRVDSVGEAVWLYVLSPTRPDLTHVVEDIGRPSISTWETKDYQPFLDRLSDGQIWSFRLTANPVHSGRKAAGSPDTQRFGHLTVGHQERWLLSRLEKWGMRPISTNGAFSDDDTSGIQLNVSGREIIQFAHGRADTKRTKVTLTRVSYEGLIEVADADQMRMTLVAGMGHAKAYGCGLMTLARP